MLPQNFASLQAHNMANWPSAGLAWICQFPTVSKRTPASGQVESPPCFYFHRDPVLCNYLQLRKPDDCAKGETLATWTNSHSVAMTRKQQPRREQKDTERFTPCPWKQRPKVAGVEGGFPTRSHGKPGSVFQLFNGVCGPLMSNAQKEILLLIQCSCKVPPIHF